MSEFKVGDKFILDNDEQSRAFTIMQINGNIIWANDKHTKELNDCYCFYCDDLEMSGYPQYGKMKKIKIEFHEDQTYTEPKNFLKDKSLAEIQNSIFNIPDDNAHIRVKISDGDNNGLTPEELIKSFEPYINSLIDKRLEEKNVQTFEMRGKSL